MNEVKCYFCIKELYYPDQATDPAICASCCNDLEKTQAVARTLKARQELNDSLKALTKIKFKGEPLRIASVFIFPNGNVAVCDQFGEQMPEYQGKWEEIKDKLLAAIETQDIKPILYNKLGIPKTTPLVW